VRIIGLRAVLIHTGGLVVTESSNIAFVNVSLRTGGSDGKPP
jgi:hypothetical protein